jgi:hypothetical protein
MGNRRALVVRERHRRGFIAAGKLKDNAGDVVLRIRWKATRNLKSLIQEFRHGTRIADFGPRMEEISKGCKQPLFATFSRVVAAMRISPYFVRGINFLG